MKDGPAGDKERSEVYHRFLELLGQHANEMSELLWEAERDLSPSHLSHLKLMVAKVLGHGHMPVQEEILQKYPNSRPEWMK